MRAVWRGDALALHLQTFAGWWKNSDPEHAGPDPAQPVSTILLATAGAGRLTMTVSISDDQGELEYRQRFSKR